ncbi:MULTISPECIES: UbiX family flavin prenyltransferase [unclassified Gilliamella]|uniref:UbiX family flavin prenyltransferase n=1 Tax=unclassified Gilliamella TaxID=2685620 RepID=UPI002269C040|nr:MULTISPECIES: UbiX family flavin prenyltransferase [unclassified Gilliamella]MCX8602544.1 UbiX family flavin prenyltransferase [Gilliamella sp. B3722]MCX8608012.1 UbiX family flavin prenyltransferase [Gilliamella sp. B3771]MCX8614256.1 UbiX family flavin prenyltransferase [Gilliamella sp. B3773]MCX8615861.1 UbiX family flavin prenyltransferase [Gilliamella sp. B3770]MCX8621488.1 UbiX family flavin prenyltransferase [Gilliamella sp. B3892]
MTARRIIIGISGATGFAYGIKALELLKPMDVETHLVISKAAQITQSYEAPDYSIKQIESLADKVYSVNNIGAAIASGSFKTIGMLVAPCSMRSLSAIANSFSDNLLTRAADVALKERRRLVLMVRESPLNLAHIKNMEAVTLMGGVIFPPVPALYQHIESIDDVITHSVARALDLFDLDIPALPRWGEDMHLNRHPK